MVLFALAVEFVVACNCCWIPSVCLAVCHKLTYLIIQSRPVYGVFGPVETFYETKISCMKLLDQVLSLASRNYYSGNLE